MLDDYRLIEPEELSLKEFLKLGEDMKPHEVRERSTFGSRLAEWVAEASIEEIARIKGIGPKRARLIKTAVEMDKSLTT